MKKQKLHIFDNYYYLLGVDSEGVKYYLQEATFNCDWYWGIGYVVTFPKHINPENAEDIDSLQHFDNLFFNKEACCYDTFTNLFEQTPLSNNEIWNLLELMKSAYNMRQYSDMMYRECAGITKNPVLTNNDVQKFNMLEYYRINGTLLPNVCQAVEKLLSD